MEEIFSKTLLKTEHFDLTVLELIMVIFILIVTIVVIKFVRYVLFRVVNQRAEEFARRHAIFQILKYLIWITSFSLSLEAVGIKLTLLLAGSAALLVGMGLGLQQIFQDIMSGVAMLIEGSLRIGDVVEIDKDTIGKVREINLRTSKIETRDHIILIVPNSRFINETVINWTHINRQTRFCVEVGVAYGSDVNLVTQVLLDCVKDHPKISTNPKPFVRFNNFGESSLDFQIFFFTNERFGAENIKSEIRYRINEAFTKHNIKIPFPQRDVYINPQ